MKVSFTAKEYTRVLELAQMGLHVAASGSEEPDVVPERYAALEQKLLELATSMGCADLVESSPDGNHLPAEKLESGVAQKLEEFSEGVFWHELVERLAERDLRAELGPDKLGDELSEEETKRLEEIEDNYWREFEVSGTDHLVILTGGRG